MIPVTRIDPSIVNARFDVFLANATLPCPTLLTRARAAILVVAAAPSAPFLPPFSFALP